jgi:hypothetical protein
VPSRGPMRECAMPGCRGPIARLADMHPKIVASWKIRVLNIIFDDYEWFLINRFSFAALHGNSNWICFVLRYRNNCLDEFQNKAEFGQLGLNSSLLFGILTIFFIPETSEKKRKTDVWFSSHLKFISKFFVNLICVNLFVYCLSMPCFQKSLLLKLWGRFRGFQKMSVIRWQTGYTWYASF